jgi:hypothetical protein
MTQYKLKEPPEKRIWKEDDRMPPNLFPDVFNLSNLKTDDKLPILKLNPLKDISKISQNKFDISVELPDLKSNIDLYLFINEIKRDMYYRVKSGRYIFRNVRILDGSNEIELFYRFGNRKSSSIHYIINGEK